MATDVFPSYLQQQTLNTEQIADILHNATSLRADLFRQFFDPRRNIDDECGYPNSETGSGVGAINPELYRALYDREAIATRVVQLMPKECWQKTPLVYETEDPDDVTPFEEAWDALGQSLRGEACYYQDEEGSPVWEYLRRADILSGIGSFGVIMLGVDDGKMLDQPIDGVVSYDPSGKPPPQNGNGKAPARNRLVVNGRMGPLEIPSMEIMDRVVWNQVKDDKGHTRWESHRENYVDVQVANELPDRHRESGIDTQPRAPTTRAKTTQGDDIFSSGEPYSGQAGYLPGSGFGTPQQAGAYGATGTDAQYVGIQLGPPEFPAADAAKEQRKLNFIRCFDESLVQIVQYEANVSNPRFGKPVMYRITLNDPREQHSGIGLPMATVRVHWSRIIHLADNLGSSEIFGVPRMRPVLNRLLDLRKLYGGSAEMYWKGAFPGMSLETVPQLGGDVKINRAQLKDDYEQYANGLQRVLMLMGMSAKMLSPTVVDPTQQINVQIEAVCIQLGCPIRVFKGSERGELASSQDDSSWNDRIRERQMNYVTPRIIVAFIDRLIQIGVLPKPNKSKKEGGDVGTDAKGNGTTGGPNTSSKIDDQGSDTPKGGNPFGAGNGKPKPAVGNTYIRNAAGQVIGLKSGVGYSIEWPDLDSLGDKDKAALALQETQAIAAYVGGNVESILPPKEYLVHVLHWEEEQADAVLDAAKSAHDDMDTMTGPPMIQGQPAKAAPGTQADSDAKAAKDAAAKQADAAAKAPQAPVVVPPGGKAIHPGDVQPTKPPGAVAQKNAQAGAKSP